jgi:hypothetical protein
MSISFEHVRLVALCALVGIVCWSTFTKVTGWNSPEPIGSTPVGQSNGKHIGHYDGVKKLIPDFTVCGEGNISTESYKDAQRLKCTAIVREATIEAQSKCESYIENEANCRVDRSSRCEVHRENIDGCQRLVVLAALGKEKLIFKGKK